MSRLVPYRTKAPPPVAERMEQILGMTMYLVQTTGPTSYVIQEQNCEKKHKVLIGALQSCSCGELDVCFHVLFVMLKVLRVPATNPIVWQKSLIDSEIEMLLRGDYREQNAAAPRPVNAFVKRRKGAASVPQTEPDVADVKRHELIEGEVCAICQEEMDNIQPLTFCRKGCGSNFHVECMKVFGESRRQSKENITCPLCRHDWGDLALTALRKESEVANRAPNVHKNVSCKKCQTKPIRNERYRCVQCKHTDLCGRCFQSNAHEKHAFVMKKNVKDGWSPGLRSHQKLPGITSDLITELESRELSTNDYDVLLQLDQREKYPLHEYLLSVLPGQKVSSADAKTFGAPGDQCAICNTSLRITADILSIPCGHAFHESCLSRSILSQMYGCPFAGCEFKIFPGLYQQTMNKGSSSKDESKPQLSVTCQGALPQVESSIHGVSIQQRDVSALQRKANSRSNIKNHGAIQQSKTNESEELPPILGHVSVGLSTQPSRPNSNSSDRSSSRAARLVLVRNQPKFGNAGIDHKSNQMESDRTERANPVRIATQGASAKNNRANSEAKLPALSAGGATPGHFPDESALMQRLDQAEKNRADLKHLEKVRLQSLRVQREERTRIHQSNSKMPLPELNGLVASMTSSTLDGRLEKAQLIRTNAQIQMKRDMVKKRQIREGNQRQHLLQNQQHQRLEDLFIGK